MVSKTLPRPSANLNDEILQYAFRPPGIPERSAFLITLAAFQRGLEVTFYRSAFGNSARFQSTVPDGFFGALFSVSDGKSVHFFSRTLGDRTSREASILAEDKDLTKQALARAGIRTPRGMVARDGDAAVLSNFLSASDCDRFVLKPLRGSIGKDTHIDIGASDVMRIFEENLSQEWLIEEYVSGQEVRAYVVGDRCVSATLMLPPTVVGNGVDTIETLIADRARARAGHLYLGTIASSLITAQLADLENNGTKPTDVPEQGKVVFLSKTKSVILGADTMNANHLVNDSFREVAIRSCKALALPNASLDIILSDDPLRPGAFVLEANQRSHICFITFPTLGRASHNDSAEAIIDMYFPGSSRNHRFVDACFDFRKIVETLQSTQVNMLKLPVLTAGWLNCRIRFEDEVISERVWQILMICGVYGRLLSVSGNHRVADVLLSPESRLSLLPYRQRIADLSITAEKLLYQN